MLEEVADVLSDVSVLCQPSALGLRLWLRWRLGLGLQLGIRVRVRLMASVVVTVTGMGVIMVGLSHGYLQA